MTCGESLMTVGDLMARFRSGNREAANQLFVLLYPEIERVATTKMTAGRCGHSWQPSLLVHELYLQLIKIKALPEPDQADRSEREHFLKFAGHVMRHLLIDRSRPLAARITKIDIAHFDVSDGDNSSVTLREIDDLLEHLAAIHPRLRSIVEMKVFEGLPVEEIAARLDIAPRTVARNWTFCKQWLREHIKRA